MTTATPAKTEMRLVTLHCENCRQPAISLAEIEFVSMGPKDSEAMLKRGLIKEKGRLPQNLRVCLICLKSLEELAKHPEHTAESLLETVMNSTVQQYQRLREEMARRESDEEELK